MFISRRLIIHIIQYSMIEYCINMNIMHIIVTIYLRDVH